MLNFCFCLVAFLSVGGLATEWQSNPATAHAWLSAVLPAAILSRNFCSQAQTVRHAKLLLLAFGFVYVPGMPAGIGYHLSEIFDGLGAHWQWLNQLLLFLLSLASHLLFFCALQLSSVTSFRGPGTLLSLALTVFLHPFIPAGSEWFAFLHLLILSLVIFKYQPPQIEVTKDFLPSGFFLWPAMMAMVPAVGISGYLPYFIWFGFITLSQYQILVHWSQPEDERNLFLLFLGIFLVANSALGLEIRQIPAFFLVFALIGWQGNDVLDFVVTTVMSLGLLLGSDHEAPTILVFFSFGIGIYLGQRILKSRIGFSWLRGLLVLSLCLALFFRPRPRQPYQEVHYRPVLRSHPAGWMLTYHNRILSRSLPLHQILDFPPEASPAYCNHIPLLPQAAQVVLSDAYYPGLAEINGSCTWPEPRPDLVTGSSHLILQVGQPYRSQQLAQFISALPKSVSGGVLLVWESALSSPRMRHHVLSAWQRRFPGSVVQIHNHLLVIANNIRWNQTAGGNLGLLPRIGLEQLLAIVLKDRNLRLRELRQALLLSQFRFLGKLSIASREELIMHILYEELDGLALNLSRSQKDQDTLNPFFPLVEKLLLHPDEARQSDLVKHFCEGGLQTEQGLHSLLSVFWLRDLLPDCSPKDPALFGLTRIRMALQDQRNLDLASHVHLGFDLIPNQWQAELMRQSLQALDRGMESTLFDSSLLER